MHPFAAMSAFSKSAGRFAGEDQGIRTSEYKRLMAGRISGALPSAPARHQDQDACKVCLQSSFITLLQLVTLCTSVRPNSSSMDRRRPLGIIIWSSATKNKRFQHLIKYLRFLILTLNLPVQVSVSLPQVDHSILANVITILLTRGCTFSAFHLSPHRSD